MKKTISFLLIFIGLLIPLVPFFLAERFAGEGPWTARIYEGEAVFQEGVRVKDFRREGMDGAPRFSREEVLRNATLLVDPEIPAAEKGEILARADEEFRALPAGEREKVLSVLTPGELAGAYISASGYRTEQILGANPYLKRVSVPYRYFLASGFVFCFLGILIRIFGTGK